MGLFFFLQTKLFPSRKTDLKFSFDNTTLPTMQIVSKLPDIQKTQIVNGKLLSPTELELKILIQKVSMEISPIINLS